jgi:hypothetical protein
MSEFHQRLRKAIERGKARTEERLRQERQQALSEEELKRLHTQYRLQLSEHIEKCISQLPDHFPGFRVETIFGEKGWGAACSRDDFTVQQGRKRASRFSRMEMTIRPFSTLFVLELAAKATIRNKEVFNRTHFEKLDDVDPDTFSNYIDVWMLEFAELYAARA